MRKVTVVGAGSWGTALAVHLAKLGHDVRLWAREPGLAAQLSRCRQNATYLPDIPLPPTIDPLADLEPAVAHAEMIVTAVPSHGLRRVVREFSPFVHPSAIVVNAAKGFEGPSLLRLSQVIEEELQGKSVRLAVLSGPSFAREVARELPTAVVAASRDGAAVEAVMAEFRAGYFRLYASDDVVGVETGGALKNIIAIAAGVVEGLGLGHNALAALVTRGLAEMSRLAVAMGARRETLAGLAGLGDLVLTCTGALSRNRHLGMALAQGQSLEAITTGMKMVAEGVNATPVALMLGRRHQIELPITEQMAAVLDGSADPRTAVEALMLRRQRSE